MLIAATGHASTHAPQSTQASPTTALPSTMLIASLGHSPTQVSQPVHFPSLTFAGIYKSFHYKVSNNAAILQNRGKITIKILPNQAEIGYFLSNA
jgi:hypothetical protein